MKNMIFSLLAIAGIATAMQDVQTQTKQNRAQKINRDRSRKYNKARQQQSPWYKKQLINKKK